MPIPKLPRPLLALSLVLPLSAFRCDSEIQSTPPAARFERVAMPTAPIGEASCDGAPCLSDRQAGQLLDDAADAICAANDKLAWLSDYYLGTRLGPSCAPR